MVINQNGWLTSFTIPLKSVYVKLHSIFGTKTNNFLFTSLKKMYRCL